MATVSCPTTRSGLWSWFTCWVCWEVKGGFLLLLFSRALMFWLPVEIGGLQWQIGWALFWAGVGLLLGGLVKDVWSLALSVRRRVADTGQEPSRREARKK